jgi:hypothetical protein
MDLESYRRTLEGGGGDSESAESAEAEFLDVIGKKVLRVFLLSIHSHLY